MEKYTAEQVATRLGVATTTIALWYKWKRHNPNHPLTDLLPEPVRISKRRYWTEDDIEKIMLFNASKPMGRGGLFAEFTYKKKEN